MKRCPFCKREFKDSLIHCVIDGHKLEPALSQQTDPARPLSDILNTEAPVAVERAISIALSLCDSLEDLHRAGRIIGDLHPQQIFVDDHGQSPVVSILREETKAQPLSASYLSPEAARQQEVDKPSDVYSVGTILYEMLTGQLPFKASSPAALIVKQLLEHPQSPRELRPDISGELQEVILRAIEKERSARQQTVRQLKQELEDAASGPTMQSSLPLQSSPPARSASPVTDRLEAATLDSFPTLASALPLASERAFASAPPPPSPAYSAAPSPQRAAASKKLLPVILISVALLAAVAVAVIFLSTGNRSTTSRVSNTNTQSPAPDPQQMPTAPPRPDETNTGKATPTSPPPRPTIPPNSNTATAPPVTSRPPQQKVNPEESVNPIFWVVLGVALAGAAGATTLLILGRKSVAARTGFQPAQHWQDQFPTPQSWPPQSWPPQPVRAGNDTAETVKTPIHEKPHLRESIKRCPSCRAEFPITGQFCVYDGNTLREDVKITPPKEEVKKDSPSFYDLQSIESKKRCPQCDTDYPVTTTFCHHDGNRLVEISPAPRPAKHDAEIEPFIIGQYRCFARLGEGGMGMVYKAYHVHLQRLSAVKVLLPQTAIIPDSVRMFRREAQLASSINHPNSVVIYDYGEVGADLFYLAMEFIPGKSLAGIIDCEASQPRPLPLARALNITRQICDALDTAHQLGIIHRDLKPQNVMINERQNRADMVKVVDFGIARSMTVPGEYETMPGTVMGTPAYMSPEQARGDVQLDGRSDIYSLGVMVYQMLSGKLPFPVKGLSVWQQVNQRATLNAPPPSLREFYPGLSIPYEVDRVLMRALAADRNHRIQSVVEFLDQLEQAARSYT
ncbi:MAG: serine/threonine-protein kinase [Blastocatellia bacterium]